MKTKILPSATTHFDNRNIMPIFRTTEMILAFLSGLKFLWLNPQLMLTRSHMLKSFLISSIAIYVQSSLARPPNDDCSSAMEIAVPNAGFGLGTFITTPVALTTATIEAGEYFYPIITNNQKSVWFYFTVATTRRVDIKLAQVSGLPSAFIGMTVYENYSCPPFPGTSSVLPDLTRNDIGSKFKGCLTPGTYYIQVSANNYNFLDSVYLEIDIDRSSFNNDYDLAAAAYDFQTVSTLEVFVDYTVGCQSIDDTTESFCPALSNYRNYTQSTWHTFTTDNYVDYIAVLVEPSGFLPFTSATVGYRLYEGDVSISLVSSLNLIDGCSALTYPYGNIKQYICTLQPNTTYSVQLLFHKNFNEDVKVKIRQLGDGPTQAPVPEIGSMAATNRLGILVPASAGNNYYVHDNLGCNARLTEPSVQCGTANVPGIAGFGTDLATWVSFELDQFANVTISANQPGIFSNSGIQLRVYNEEITNDCNDIDAGSLFSAGYNYISSFCMPPGKYSLQVLGRSEIPNGVWNHYYSNFGRPVDVTIQVTTMRQSNLFNLSAPGMYNQINSMQPLSNGVTYTSVVDMFGCDSTVLPPGVTACNYYITKGMYRILSVGDSNNSAIPDSGVLTISDINIGPSYSSPKGYHLFYQGNANDLAIAQNAFVHDSTLTGLTPFSGCISVNTVTQTSYSYTTSRFCITEGDYTFATFGGYNQINEPHSPKFTFRADNQTIHNSPANAENLGAISLARPSVTSAIDYFSCKDNPFNLPGYPCFGNYPKVIYREFYLQDTSAFNITVNFAGTLGILSGQISVAGASGVTAISNSNPCDVLTCTGACHQLPPGWYTVLALGSGPNYTNNPLYTSTRGGVAGDSNRITISLATYIEPKYNRPYKACYRSVWWGPNTNTANYPDNDRVHTLCTETFACDADTPFSLHPIIGCPPPSTFNRTAYYVFSLTQPSFVIIDNIAGSHVSNVFGFDVRTDSVRMITEPPVQPCFSGDGFIQLCNLQPGFYTLVVFASDYHMFRNLTPRIYIDSVGISKYDHAINAYDFGVLNANNNWYNGANHLAFLPGIAPSNDFFFCSTGARQTDPDVNTCYSNQINYDWAYNANVYPFHSSYPLFYSGNLLRQPRRNLWYSFVLDKKGTCSVKVDNKTPNRTLQYPFAVFRSNGGIDSTYAQGLSFVMTNKVSGYNQCNYLNSISFSTCDIDAPTRFYVIIDNPSYSSMRPNSQLEVSIRHDSIPVRYDHCYTANVINGLNQVYPPYADSLLTYGEYEADPGSFLCATADAPDHTFGRCGYYNYYSTTLWYRFETATAGTIMVSFEVNGATRRYHSADIMLLRDNDISVNNCGSSGLTRVSLDSVIANGHTWGEGCFAPGVYYIMLTGCNYTTENLAPVIKLLPVVGDFCSNPMVVPVNGIGTVNSSVAVDCHTMTPDFGEDGSNLLCMAGPSGFKSSWFRIDLTGSEKYDLAFHLDGTVNRLPVYYRVLYGNCSSMSVDASSCSSLHNGFTLECLYEGSYYVQVFSLVSALGDIDLHITSTQNTNTTCNPITPDFYFSTDCLTDTVFFTNYSAGANLTYEWTFGPSNVQSSLVNPYFIYQRQNTLQTVEVNLRAIDTVHGIDRDTTMFIGIYPSMVNILENDTMLCPGNSLTLTTYPGGTFTWQNGSTNNSFLVVDSGLYWASDPLGCADSVVVDYTVAPVVNLGDYSFCAGDSRTLDAGNPGASYVWSTGDSSQSILVSSSDLYRVSVTDSFGCSSAGNSIVAIHPLPVADAGTDQTICFGENIVLVATGGDFYRWSDSSNSSSIIVSLDSTADFSVTVTDSYGCSANDSVNVAVNYHSHAIANAMVCEGESYFAGGQNQFSSGTYRDTILSANGCDSIVTTNLTVLDTANTLIDTSVCNGTSIYAGGGLQDVTGIYYDMLTTRNGCDSIVTTRLTVLQHSYNTIDMRICQGDSIYAGGRFQTITGVYYDTLTAQNTCDSIITTYLTVLQHSYTAIDAEICDGESFYAAGEWKTITGIYYDTLSASNSCDSIITTNLSVLQHSYTTIDMEICDGESIYAGGRLQTTTGIYYDTLPAGNSCDSIITTNLTVLNRLSATIDTHICSGQSIYAGGGLQTTAGIYQDTLIASSSCDSFITTTLSVDPVPIGSITAIKTILCSGETDNLTASGGTHYLWSTNDTTATIIVTPSSNSLYSVEISAGACTVNDSIIIFVNPLPVVILSHDTAVCAGESVDLSVSGGLYYQWSTSATSQVITVSLTGTYFVSVTGVNGCVKIDSVLLFNHPLMALSGTSENPRCAGASDGIASVSVTGGTSPFSYRWSNASQLQSLNGLTAGQYSVTVSDTHDCSETIAFSLIDPASLLVQGESSDITCYGHADGLLTVTASGGTPGYLYSIDGGISFHSFNVFSDLEEGEYTVVAKDSNNCIATMAQSFYITEPAAITIDLIPDRSELLFGQSIELATIVSGNAVQPFVFVWTPVNGLECTACPHTLATPLQTTTYLVELKDYTGCKAEDSVLVLVNDEDKILYIPNTFTPNGDGINDEFKVYARGVKSAVLKIFDRWGEKLFETNDINIGWDGTFRGQPMNPGVYVFTADLEFLDDTNKRNKGSVTLIR